MNLRYERWRGAAATPGWSRPGCETTTPVVNIRWLLEVDESIKR